MRTRAPVTKPSIMGKTGIPEALISVLYRPSVEGVSLCCSHHENFDSRAWLLRRNLSRRALPLRPNHQYPNRRSTFGQDRSFRGIIVGHSTITLR
jgi:hypothetical protein